MGVPGPPLGPLIAPPKPQHPQAASYTLGLLCSPCTSLSLWGPHVLALLPTFPCPLYAPSDPGSPCVSHLKTSVLPNTGPPYTFFPPTSLSYIPTHVGFLGSLCSYSGYPLSLQSPGPPIPCTGGHSSPADLRFFLPHPGSPCQVPGPRSHVFLVQPLLLARRSLPQPGSAGPSCDCTDPALGSAPHLDIPVFNPSDLVPSPRAPPAPSFLVPSHVAIPGPPRGRPGPSGGAPSHIPVLTGCSQCPSGSTDT